MLYCYKCFKDSAAEVALLTRLANAFNREPGSLILNRFPLFKKYILPRKDPNAELKSDSQ